MTPPPVTGAMALRDVVARLQAAGVDGAARDARLLLAHALGVGPDRVTLVMHDPLTHAALARLEAATTARCARKPIAQITGQRRFWGHVFAVTPAVLDPRPDTETLVEQALSIDFANVLDLGTGSGAILLSLLAARPQAQGLGVDLSPEALAVARRNADALGVAARVRLAVSDWFGAVTGLFDLIVSNPPYIAADEMAALAPEVRNHEPHLALTPGGDGLGAYRVICAQARGHLRPGGWLMLEIGPTQAQAVTALLKQAGFASVTVCPDLDGRDRVLRARAP